MISVAGYSGTPLAKKLGIKPGYILRLIDQPVHYFELFADLPENLQIVSDPEIAKDLIHLFTKDLSKLEQLLPELRKEIRQNGMIWVSWPKKSAKIPTDITEDAIRECALRSGLVDVKVCAVDDVWSGLKLVIPVKDRQ